jgi:O-antigen/teichoic acid export membrane protein
VKMAEPDHAGGTADSAALQEEVPRGSGGRPLQIARLSVRGSLVLFLGQFVSTVVSAAALILVARLLGPASFGIYSLALLIPNILQLFTGFGLIAAVTRYAAHYSSLGMDAVAARYTRNAIIFMMGTAVAMACVDLLAAPVLSQSLLRRPDITGYVELGSLIVIGVTLLNGAFAAALGWGAMGMGGLSYVAQAAARLVLSVGLLLAGFGILGALLGHIASYMIAGCLVVLALQTTVFDRRSRRLAPGAGQAGGSTDKESGGSFVSDVVEMVRYGFPTYISSVLAGL